MSRVMARSAGAPLVFVGLVVAMWTAGRVVTLAADASETRLGAAFHSPAASARSIGFIADTRHFRPSPGGQKGHRIWHPAEGLSHIWAIPAVEEPLQGDARTEFVALPEPRSSRSAQPSQDFAAADRLPPFPAGVSVPKTSDRPAEKRLRGAAWVLWRDRSSATSLARSGQLGGAQAGVRIDYRLNPSGKNPVFAYGRASSALYSPRSEELAVGLVWRPGTPLPVSLGVERRIAVGRGARNAFAIIATTGIGPMDIAPGVRVEGYGQAGVVGVRRRDAFVDGRVALTHPIANTPFSAGVSVSGGAQPNVSRLDVGPVIDARIKLKGVQPRLSVEWRERVAGNAAPNSGPAVTLATDF